MGSTQNRTSQVALPKSLREWGTLERCLRGKSQNKSESLHSKLWIHQSKAKFADLKRVQFVTQLTILDHNFGFVAKKFLQHLEFAQSTESLLTKERMDRRKTPPPQSAK